MPTKIKFDYADLLSDETVSGQIARAFNYLNFAPWVYSAGEQPTLDDLEYDDQLSFLGMVDEFVRSLDPTDRIDLNFQARVLKQLSDRARLVHDWKMSEANSPVRPPKWPGMPLSPLAPNTLSLCDIERAHRSVAVQLVHNAVVVDHIKHFTPETNHCAYWRDGSFEYVECISPDETETSDMDAREKEINKIKISQKSVRPSLKMILQLTASESISKDGKFVGLKLADDEEKEDGYEYHLRQCEKIKKKLSIPIVGIYALQDQESAEFNRNGVMKFSSNFWVIIQRYRRARAALSRSFQRSFKTALESDHFLDLDIAVPDTVPQLPPPRISQEILRKIYLTQSNLS